MNRFPATPKTLRRLRIALLVIILLLIEQYAVEPFLLDQGSQHVLVMPLLPVLRSWAFRLMLSLVSTLAFCFIYHEMRRQFSAIGSRAAWLCWVLIVVMLVIRVFASVLTTLVVRQAPLMPETGQIKVVTLINGILYLIFLMAQIALSLILILRYEGRLRVVGYILLGALAVELLFSSASGGFFFTLLTFHPLIYYVPLLVVAVKAWAMVWAFQEQSSAEASAPSHLSS